jgi:DNA-binding NarL/FixJ family response regulator
MNTSPMRLLLVEDEIDTALRFSDYAKDCADIKFVGMTDSCEEGLQIVKSRLPEGVILDLQLTKGKGSGLEFLEALYEAELTLRPLIVVTTTNPSGTVQAFCEELGADFFFCKSQQGYSEEYVIKTLLRLRRVLDSKQKKRSLGLPVHTDLQKSREMVETPDDRRTRIYNRIDIELDLFGIRAKLHGRRYLKESIYVQIHSDKDRGSGIEEVAAKHNYTYASIIKTMQRAIDDAWDNGDTEEILQHFTARVTSKNGVPYVSDFIHFYADKIRNSI